MPRRPRLWAEPGGIAGDRVQSLQSSPKRDLMFWWPPKLRGKHETHLPLSDLKRAGSEGVGFTCRRVASSAEAPRGFLRHSSPACEGECPSLVSLPQVAGSLSPRNKNARLKSLAGGTRFNTPFPPAHPANMAWPSYLTCPVHWARRSRIRAADHEKPGLPKPFNSVGWSYSQNPAACVRLRRLRRIPPAGSVRR
jgi:hypothetical protein